MTKAQLQKNVESAMKSLELENFTYTDAEKALFAKISSGEIMTAQALEIFKRMP